MFRKGKEGGKGEKKLRFQLRNSDSHLQKEIIGGWLTSAPRSSPQTIRIHDHEEDSGNVLRKWISV